jgi:integrase
MRKTSKNGNGMGYLRKRSDGRWELSKTITYANGDKKRKSFYGHSKAEVYRKYEAYLKDIAIMPSRHSTITVTTYMRKYFLPAKKLSLKTSSFNRLVKTVEYQVIPIIGEVNVQQLTKYNILDMLQQLQDDGKSISTRRKAYYAVRAMCNFAKGELIMQSPCDMIPVPSDDTGTDHPVLFLDDKEIIVFKKELFGKYKNGTYCYGKNRWALMLELQTGLRPGEICGLLYGDINFDDKHEPESIHVRHTVIDVQDVDSDLVEKTKPVIQNSTKTKGSNRTVPLNDIARKCVLELIDANHAEKPRDKVVTSKSGGVLSPKVLTKTYNRVIAATNGAIDPKKRGAHTLRRTFATQLFERDMDIKVVSQLLGHASIQTTLDIYIGLSKNKLNKELQKLDNI